MTGTPDYGRRRHREDCRIEERWIDHDGFRIFTKSWIPGRPRPGGVAPIVLCHDSLGSVDQWRDFPVWLAQETGHPVYAYDRHGFGRSAARSDRPGRAFIREEGQRHIPAICDHLSLDEIILCGHSVGGAMAMETASHHPSRCQAVITIAAQAFVEDKTLAGVREARRQFATDPGLLDRLARYHGEKARWVLHAWTETWLSADFANWTLNEAIAAVQCPVLAIQGAADAYGTPAHAHRIAEAEKATALIIPEAGHFPHKNMPQRLIDEMAAFLVRLQPATNRHA